MKVSLKWLKDYVKYGVSADKLSQRLTMAGLEIEKEETVNGDTVFELEITPNRPDCLNMWGIAREVSAILNKDRIVPKVVKRKMPSKKCAVAIKDKQACQRYLGTLVEGISIKDASKHIRERIEALGMRAVNNVVDITNFVLWETGQPLHAFDYDKLAGGKIIVRRAKQGETIVTLDDIERELDPSILVIADAEKPVAIAGVMGGKGSEVTGTTQNILLESAYFDPIVVRRASRRLGLSSDSSYRFERGVAYDNVSVGSSRALDLILESVGGKVTQHADEKGAAKTKTNKAVSISVYDINHLLGADITATQCKTILSKLGFKVSSAGKGFLNVTPPDFRNDIKEPVDVIEEVSRVIGYDNLPSTLPNVPVTDIPTHPHVKVKHKIRELMTSQGFSEVITYTMLSQELLDLTNQKDKKGIAIQNPLTQDQEMLRPTALPSLLKIVQGNINRGQKDLKFFEIGKTYNTPREEEYVAFVVNGARGVDWRVTKKEPVDFYDMKGAVEALLSGLGIDNVEFNRLNEIPYLETGLAVELVVDGKVAGEVGAVNRDVQDQWGFKYTDIYFGKIELPALYKGYKDVRRFKLIPEYPAIVRDVSLAVKRDVSFQSIQDVARAKGTDLLKSTTFNEEYLGDKIAKDQRGIIFSLYYRSDKRTLRDEEVQAIHQCVLDALVSDLGVTIR